MLAVHHLLFLPCWWQFSLWGVGCWDGPTEQNLKVSQAASSIHTTGKPLELQQARRSTHITDSSSEASQSFCTHRFGVDSSQHPHKAKLKLQLEPCFGTAHVPPVLQHLPRAVPTRRKG